MATYKNAAELGRKHLKVGDTVFFRLFTYDVTAKCLQLRERHADKNWAIFYKLNIDSSFRQFIKNITGHAGTTGEVMYKTNDMIAATKLVKALWKRLEEKNAEQSVKSAIDEATQFFQELTEDLVTKVDPIKYPGSRFWFRGDKWMMQTENSTLWISYEHIWDKISKKYSWNYSQTQAFIQEQVEQHFKMKNVTPKVDGHRRCDQVEQHFKEQDTPAARPDFSTPENAITSLGQLQRWGVCLWDHVKIGKEIWKVFPNCLKSCSDGARTSQTLLEKFNMTGDRYNWEHNNMIQATRVIAAFMLADREQPLEFPRPGNAVFNTAAQLMDYTLQVGDVVKFNVGGIELTYVVKELGGDHPEYLSITEPYNLNDEVFSLMGVDRYKLAHSVYGYEPGEGLWPTAKKGRLDDMTRLVIAIYKRLEKMSAQNTTGGWTYRSSEELSRTNLKPGDKIVLTFPGSRPWRASVKKTTNGHYWLDFFPDVNIRKKLFNDCLGWDPTRFLVNVRLGESIIEFTGSSEQSLEVLMKTVTEMFWRCEKLKQKEESSDQRAARRIAENSHYGATCNTAAPAPTVVTDLRIGFEHMSIDWVKKELVFRIKN